MDPGYQKVHINGNEGEGVNKNSKNPQQTSACREPLFMLLKTKYYLLTIIKCQE